MVCMGNTVLFNYKEEWNFAICNKMDGSREYGPKWNKPEKEIPRNFTPMRNLRNKQRKRERQTKKLTFIYRGQTGGYNGGGGFEIDEGG